MSQAELAAWLECRDAHWCSQYQTAPAPDEESEIVAQFLAAPYPYQNDDDDDDDGQEHQKRHQHELGVVVTATSATYWPEPCHVTGPGAADTGNSSASGGTGAYFDSSDCCCCYLAEPDVSLGINTLTTLPCTPAIDLNLLGGDGEEERSVCVDPIPPDPSPQPKRKVQAGRDGDLGRHKKGRASDNVRKQCFSLRSLLLLWCGDAKLGYCGLWL